MKILPVLLLLKQEQLAAIFTAENYRQTARSENWTQGKSYMQGRTPLVHQAKRSIYAIGFLHIKQIQKGLMASKPPPQ
jgi:hypothetical protein